MSVPERGLVSPVEEPEPDRCNLNKIVAENMAQPKLQAVLCKYAGDLATHKQDCGCMAVTLVVDGRDGPAQKQYSYPDQAKPCIDRTVKSLLTQGMLCRCTSTTSSPIGAC